MVDSLFVKERVSELLAEPLGVDDVDIVVLTLKVTLSENVALALPLSEDDRLGVILADDVLLSLADVLALSDIDAL